jgi:hypothetical protein
MVANSGDGPDRKLEEEAGSIYASFIGDQLEDERSRQTSIEQRGLSVITTSGVLVTLLFGFSALVTRTTSFQLENPARLFLEVSLISFVVAAVSGILTNWPLPYSPVDEEDLKRLIEPNYWHRSSSPAARRVAEDQIETLTEMHRSNNFRSRVLLAAMAAEILAIILLACSIGVILR